MRPFESGVFGAGLQSFAMARATAAIHVGLHKTGTTAFQEALDLAAGELSERGVQVMQYFGPLYRDTPVSQAFDLANAVVRLDIDAYFRLRAPESLLASVLAESERSVRAYAAAPAPHLVASMESLSLISSVEEVERMVDLLSPREVSVVLVLREKSEFLRSLRLQVARLGLPTSSEFHDSCLYLEDDTWLADFDRMIGNFVSVLGDERVTVVDYDAVVRRDGTVVPALWVATGLPSIPSKSEIFGREWVNLTPEAPSSPPAAEPRQETERALLLRRIRQRLVGRIRR